MTFFVEGLSLAPESMNQVRRIGRYSQLRDALVAAEEAISAFLVSAFEPGMTAGMLFERYKTIGEVPYIFRDDGEITMNLPGFNHFRYALSKCAEIAEAHRSFIPVYKTGFMT
jgi:hypothetical protein